jgi:cytochrome P450
MAVNKFPPGPKSAFGAIFAFHRNALSYLSRLTRKYGDIVHLKMDARHDYLIAHPDYVKAVILADESEMRRSIHRAVRRLFGKGLLASQGELHVSQRRLILPIFQKQRIATYSASITDRIDRASNQWRDGQVIDIAEEMTALSLAIIVKILFGVDIEEEARSLREDLGAVVARTEWRNLFRTKKEFQAARGRLDAFLHRMIQEHRAKQIDQPDLLSALLQATDSQGLSMGDEQIRDEAVTLLAAGHETIATSMAWTWYLLSLHPEVERRVHQELDTVLGGNTPTAEDLPRLTYASMVIAESMRLYPPVWSMTRRPIRDFPLGDYVIPAESYIHISPYVLQRDPRFFTEPERFDPMRWTLEEYAKRPKFCYFPFGAGSRKCVGDNLGLMEGMLILVMLAQHWTLRLASQEPWVPQPLITLRPKGNTNMKLQRRLPENSGQLPDPERILASQDDNRKL